MSRVLIVEGGRSDRSGVGQVLRRYGHDVAEASERDAEGMLRSEDFESIVIEVGENRPGSWETLERIKTDHPALKWQVCYRHGFIQSTGWPDHQDLLKSRDGIF